MKSQTRSHLEVEVCVMHPVNPPRQRNRVKGPAQQIDHKSEGDRRCHRRDRAWQHDPIEQSVFTLFGGERGRDRRDRNQDSYRDTVDR